MFTSYQVEEAKYSIKDLADAYIQGARDSDGEEPHLCEFKQFLNQKHNL